MKCFAHAFYILFCLLASANIFAFAEGNFVRVHGLQEAVNLNERPAMIIGKSIIDKSTGESRYPVLVWLDDKSSSFKKVYVKVANLAELDVEPANPPMLRDEQIHMFSGVITSLGEPGWLIDGGETEKKCRIIGAAISSQFGMDGMRDVAEHKKDIYVVSKAAGMALAIGEAKRPTSRAQTQTRA